MGKDMPNLDSSLFRINLPTSQPRPGVLLVAEPFLREDYFNHAVITLIEYDKDKSSMGLVLNKPTGYTLGEAIEGIDDNIDTPIYCGGPVSCDRMFYIHSLGNEFPHSRKLSDDLYIGGDFESVKSYVNMGLPTEGIIRFFVGYSGWSRGQLEDELAGDVWALTDFDNPHELLHGNGDPYWHRCVRHMGEPYRSWQLLPRNIHAN